MIHAQKQRFEVFSQSTAVITPLRSTSLGSCATHVDEAGVNLALR